MDFVFSSLAAFREETSVSSLFCFCFCLFMVAVLDTQLPTQLPTGLYTELYTLVKVKWLSSGFSAFSTSLLGTGLYTLVKVKLFILYFPGVPRFPFWYWIS